MPPKKRTATKTIKKSVAAPAVAKLRSDKPGGNYFASPKTSIKFIRTGSKMLDLCLGGGWAMRRISNVVGDRSTGKTLVAMEAIANFCEQYPKGKVHYREIEEAFDDPYARALGIPMDRVDRGKTPLATVDDLYEDLAEVIGIDVSKEGNISITKKHTDPIFYIVDSLDGLSTRDEMQGDLNAGYAGARKAASMSALFRRINGIMSRANVTFQIISQTRDKIGIFFGSKHTRAGGKALDFYESQELWLTEMGKVVKTINTLKRPIGIDVGARVKKNKVGLAYRDVKFCIRFGFGIDDLLSCMEWLKQVHATDEVLDGMKYDAFMEHMWKCSPADHAEQMVRIHTVTERTWYEVEQKFLPPRRKYGEQ